MLALVRADADDRGRRDRRHGKWHLFAVDRNRQGFQFVAIEHQRLRGNARIAAQRQRGGDGRAAGFNDQIEVDSIDQEGGRGVVLEMDRLRSIGFHCLSSIEVGSADDKSKRRGRFLRGGGGCDLRQPGRGEWCFDPARSLGLWKSGLSTLVVGRRDSRSA